MTFIFGIVLGFVWAITLITVMSQNPTTGFEVPWVIRHMDQEGRPAKGTITFPNKRK